MRSIILALLMAAPLPALADVKSDLTAIDSRLKACIAKDGSTAGMVDCTHTATTAADKILTNEYRSAVERLKHTPADGSADDDKETLARLIASERTWVAFKESDCKFQSVTMLGGTGEGLIVEDCLYRMTRDRAKSLDEVLSTH